MQYSQPLFFFSGCRTLATKFLSEDTRPYDFGKTRWGYTTSHVELMMHREDVTKLVMRRPDLLIYADKLEDVPVLRVFTFKKNKLRTAGYMTLKPA